MGILMGVGILWVFTELMYRKTPINEDLKLRLSKVVSRIDGATLMFFLGILLAVDALRCSGVLGSFSLWLDNTIGNVYAVNLIIGTLSAIVDNVPLVAGAIGMYPVASGRDGCYGCRSGLYSQFRTRRRVLAIPRLLCRRGWQHADHRFCRRVVVDGTGRDQLHLVSEKNLVARPDRISVGSRSLHPAKCTIRHIERFLVYLSAININTHNEFHFKTI